MTRVLITGGAGMVGVNLTCRLLRTGHQVSALVRPSSDRAGLDDFQGQLQLILGDITEAATVRKAVADAQPDVVYHLASTPFNPSTIPAEEHVGVIVQGTVHLLEAVRQTCPHIPLVSAGSAAVYGAGSHLAEDCPLQPATVLGAAKAAASTFLQTYARLYGLRTVELRLFMPYGPWERPRRLLPQAFAAAFDHQDLPMTRGDQERDLIHVDDVVEALCLAATAALAPGTVLNIGSGTGTPIKEVVEMVFALAKSRGRPVLGAVPTRADEIMHMSADIRQAERQLGWRPRTSLADGLRQTAAWFAANRRAQPLAA